MKTSYSIEVGNCPRSAHRSGRWGSIARIFVCAFLFGTAATAAEGPPPAEFEVTLKGLSTGGNIVNLWLHDGEQHRHFPLSGSRISAPLRVRTDGRLLLYKSFTDPESGQTAYRTCGAVRLAPEERNYLLLVNDTGNEGSPSAYDVHALERPPSLNPRGSVEFLNLSGQRIACRLNESDFVLEPGASTRLRPSTTGDLSLGLRIAKQTEAAWELGFNSVWSHHESLCTLVVILKHPSREAAIIARRLYDEPVEGKEEGRGEADGEDGSKNAESFSG